MFDAAQIVDRLDPSDTNFGSELVEEPRYAIACMGETVGGEFKTLRVEPLFLQPSDADELPTGSSVGRMLDNRGEKTRLRICEATSNVFRQHGYTATTVDDLCRAAEVS